MNIEPPPSSRPREIGVPEPLAPAYERMKQMLFKPFDLGKWITIGFCAWLAGLAEGGGGGGGFNGGNGGHHYGNGQPAAEQLRQVYHEASHYVSANLVWLLPLVTVAVLVGVAVWLLVLWLDSRGKFMLLHCVALDTAEVAVPWGKFAVVANSLFRFRIGLSLVAAILLLPLLVLLFTDILAMVMAGQANVAGVLLAVGLGLAVFFVAMVLAVTHKFMVDFVVPILFLRGGNWLAAWREFGGLLFANAGKFTLYLLFQLVLSWAIGLMVLLAILLTCCIAGCLMLLPFVGTVLLLPVLVFKRAYPLYYLAQYGPHYDVFPPVPVPSPVA